MIDIFFYYVATLSFAAAFGSILLVYRYFLGNRLVAQSNKLRSQIANLKQNYPELQENRRSLVAGGMKDIGIDGLLDELGVPAAFKPLAQGFIDKIAQNPEIIKGFAEKLGVKLTDGKNPETKEITYM